jgi:hypothetical protein
VSSLAKGGAPRGNHNALKHGFYSRAYRRGEIHSTTPATLNPMQAEIFLYKVLIDRFAVEIKSASEDSIPYSEYLYTLHTLTMAINGLISFQQNPRWKIPDSDKDIRNWSELVGITEEQMRRDLENYALTGSTEGSVDLTGKDSAKNENFSKLGFYAEVFEPQEIRRLLKSDPNSLKEEILLLRTLIKRTVRSIKNEGWSNLTYFDRNRAFRIITLAGACLFRLNRLIMVDRPKGSLLKSLLFEAIKEVNPNGDLRPSPGRDPQTTSAGDP